MSEKRSSNFVIILLIIITLMILAGPALNNYLVSRGIITGIKLNFGDFGISKTINNIFSNIASSFAGWGR